MKKPEQRRNFRFRHRARVFLENLDTGPVRLGHLVNYSNGGFYFESDTLLETSDDIYLGIQNSPYHCDENVYECHRVEIVWRKTLTDATHRYGYGARHLDNPTPNIDELIRYFGNIPKHIKAMLSLDKEERSHERKAVNRRVSVYRPGILKNVSRRGMFIESQNGLRVGEVLYIKIPGTRFDNDTMLKARVVRKESTGIGVKVIGVETRKKRT